MKAKTWSRGTNSRLPLGVNLNLNLSIGEFFSPLRSNIPRGLCKSYLGAVLVS